MKIEPLLKRVFTILGYVIFTCQPLLAADLSWSEATSGNDKISAWLRTIILAVMACFVMVSIILGSLAFKQLAADGNWKDFWSKIAGAIGMFVTPIAIYWIVSKSTNAPG